MKFFRWPSIFFFDFIEKRKKLSNKKNFLDGFSVLLPFYSLICFIFMIESVSSLKIHSLLDLLLAYCYFVFILPAILAFNHSFIFSAIIHILKNKNQPSINRPHEHSSKLDLKPEIHDSFYHENELKITKIFQKQ